MSEDREDTETAPLQSEGDAGEPMVEAEADQPTPKKERPRAHAIGEVLEGKRIKKTVERLDFQISIPQEKVKVENGGGDKLGDIPRTKNQLLKMKAAELRPLHIILFERPGKMTTLKRNMRLFNGFTFAVDSQPYIRRREKMLRSFSSTNLKVICNVLALKKGGSKPELIDRILTFLVSPRNHGKKSLTSKKRKSKKMLSGSDSKAKTKKKRKPKPKGTSASPKKAKSASKSKAIVMDWSSSDESSSDDDDDDKDEADEKIGVTLDGTDSDSEKKPMEEKDESDSDSEKILDSDEEDEAESPVSKKSTTVKRQRASAKKTGPPKKKAKRELSDESEAGTESEPEEKPKKKNVDKKATPDSSSNGKKTTSTVTEDSSDDDTPLIKMVKKPPSDEQLMKTVQNLLKEVNLEEITMKQICQRVYDTYPDIDLTCRKDYIKQTVKMLIS